jgi:phytoene synthase
MQAAGIGLDSILRACAGEAIEPAVIRLLQHEIDRAQAYYRSAESLIPMLSPDSRAAMRVLVRIYHRLLDRIAAEPSAIFQQRVSVPAREKLAILGLGLLQSFQVRLLP